MTVANVRILHKRGNNLVSGTYTGPIGEITVDTTTYQLRVHDGSTAGGNVIPTLNGILGNITQANLGMKGYVDSVASQSIYGNVNVKAYTETMGFQNFSNVNVAALITTNGLTNYSNVNTKAYTETMGFQNFSNVNVAAYVTTANSAVIGYIDQANTIQTAYINGQITAANVGVTAANVGMLGYVNQANTTMKAYVDGQISAANSGASSYSNVNTLAYLTTNSYATEAFVNTANTSLKVYTDGQITASNTAVIDANIGMLGYVYQANATLRSYVDGQITAANSAVTAANLGMKGYVDSLTYSNVQVAAYLPTYDGSFGGNIDNHNGYINFTASPSPISTGITFFDGTSQTTAFTDTSANIRTAAYLPTYTGNVQASNFNATDSGNMLSLITRNGDSNNSYAQPQITMGYAGTTNYPSFIHTTHNDGTPVDNTIEFWTCDGSQFGTFPANVVLGLTVTNGNIKTGGILTNNYYYANGTPVTFGSGSTYGNVEVATYLPTHTGNVQAGNVKAVTAYRFATGAVTITNDDSHVVLNPDTGANALAGVKVGGNGYILGPNASRCITLNYGSVGGAVGLQSNVTIGTGGSGNLWVYGNVIAGDVTAGNISASGTSGKLGYVRGGFVQQTTSNANGVSLNTVTGNIQLMGINLGVNGFHTVALSSNKLEESDMILVTHLSGGIGTFAVGAYYLTTGTALIWLRNITGSDTSTVTPMLKFAIIKAPSS